MGKYFDSGAKSHRLISDPLSDFLEQLTFHVNSVGTWKRDKQTLANYTIKDVEFIFYTSGESSTNILGTEYTCYTHDMMILQPMQLYTSQNKDQLHTEYQFIHFDVQPISHLRPFLDLFHSAVIRMQSPDETHALIRSIQQQVYEQQPGYITNINALLKLLIVQVLRSQQAIPNCTCSLAPLHTGPQLFVDQCIAYIGNHLKDDCSVQALSHHFSVSNNYIYKSFMKVLNQSPSRYVTQLRMFRAKSLLLTDLFTIEEVAEEVGYSSLAHFSKVFKENNQCSPSEYRRKNRT